MARDEFHRGPFIHHDDMTRQTEADRVNAALELVDKMMEHEMREDPPWEDPYFRMAVRKRLREIPKLREDARKLAIVKEVFGGTR